MTERDIAITVMVLLCVVSILTTPFMLVKRGAGHPRPSIARSGWQKALLITSNVALVVLLGWLAWYLWQALT